MKFMRVVIVALIVIMTASCQLKPTWDAIGKWQKVDGTETIEFNRNSTIHIADTNTEVTAPFKFNDAKHLQIDVGSLGSVVLGANVTKDTLTLTDAKGTVMTYKKVK